MAGAKPAIEQRLRVLGANVRNDAQYRGNPLDVEQASSPVKLLKQPVSVRPSLWSDLGDDLLREEMFSVIAEENVRIQDTP